jgi:hypothetical protein
MVELTPNGIGLLDLYLGDRLQRGGVRTEPCPENARSGRSGTPVGIVVLVTAALSAGITYLAMSFGALARVFAWN